MSETCVSRKVGRDVLTERAFSAMLREVETEFEFEGSVDRSKLLSACETYRQSRYELGRELSLYRAKFKREGGWLAAVGAIAGWLRVSDKTVVNIADDYRRVEAEYPASVITAAMKAEIDPAARRNGPVLVQAMKMIPRDRDLSEDEAARLFPSAQAAVENARIAKRAATNSLSKNERQTFVGFQALLKVLGEVSQAGKQQYLKTIIGYVLFDSNLKSVSAEAKPVPVWLTTGMREVTDGE